MRWNDLSRKIFLVTGFVGDVIVGVKNQLKFELEMITTKFKRLFQLKVETNLILTKIN